MRKVHKFDIEGLSEKAIKMLVIHHNDDVRRVWKQYRMIDIPKVEFKPSTIDLKTGAFELRQIVMAK